MYFILSEVGNNYKEEFSIKKRFESLLMARIVQ